MIQSGILLLDQVSTDLEGMRKVNKYPRLQVKQPLSNRPGMPELSPPDGPIWPTDSVEPT